MGIDNLVKLAVTLVIVIVIVIAAALTGHLH